MPFAQALKQHLLQRAKTSVFWVLVPFRWWASLRQFYAQFSFAHVKKTKKHASQNKKKEVFAITGQSKTKQKVDEF